MVVDPTKRISASDALKHEYFVGKYNLTSNSLEQGLDIGGALVSQMSEPKISDSVLDKMEFKCPKCSKKFNDINSCLLHANSRKHSRFCSYDQSVLPPCLSSHAMLPAHPTSGSFIMSISRYLCFILS